LDTTISSVLFSICSKTIKPSKKFPNFTLVHILVKSDRDPIHKIPPIVLGRSRCKNPSPPNPSHLCMLRCMVKLKATGLTEIRFRV